METPDVLCTTCSKIDLFSLFTGPRYFPGLGYHDRVSVSLGTLAEVNANTTCPLCRLVRHDIFISPVGTRCLPEDLCFRIESIDPSKVKVVLCAERNDIYEGITYCSKNAADRVATRLGVFLQPLDGLSALEKKAIEGHPPRNGILLLSPDSIDPMRPLLNGFKATNSTKNLDLLQGWIDACVQSHALDPDERACHPVPISKLTSTVDTLRLIDVHQRTIVEIDPKTTQYAALSYVWPRNASLLRTGMRMNDVSKSDGTTAMITVPDLVETIPSNVPKIVEDAIFVCKKLSIPHLWIDRYCIDQENTKRKEIEIENMGHYYLHARITLIAGRDPDDGLLSQPELDRLGKVQRIETVQGRQYITALPSLSLQMSGSQWSQRSWTFQEGQLSNRCAFLGYYDISFLCGAGHWRETLHSGPYNHETIIEEMDTTCVLGDLLHRVRWLSDEPLAFHDYSMLVMDYSKRQLTFESDKLKAIAGCLNLISERKNISFALGLPLMDFHCALLWHGQYDRPREGFPSWSWAGWHAHQNSYNLVFPRSNGTCFLENDGKGNLHTKGPISKETEMTGWLFSDMEDSFRKAKCRQRFAKITLPAYQSNSILTIETEIAHFFLEMRPSSLSKNARSFTMPDVPHDLTSMDQLARQPNAEYSTLPFSFLLHDSFGNKHTVHKYQKEVWPPLICDLGYSLRGETLAWLLKDGIDLVMILELEMIEGDEGIDYFHLVFCLGLDRRSEVVTRRGIFVLPKEVWDKARPSAETVYMG